MNLNALIFSSIALMTIIVSAIVLVGLSGYMSSNVSFSQVANKRKRPRPVLMIKRIFKLITVALALPLAGLPAAGCGQAAKPLPPPLTASFEEAPASPARPALSGRSYTVRGQRYQLLADAAGYQAEGLGTRYGGRFHGRKTASGETFDQNKLTAAHRTLPFNSLVEVRNIATGKTVVVRINDRGPFHDGYVIDLSQAAANKIGLLSNGPVAVRGLEGQAGRP